MLYYLIKFLAVLSLERFFDKIIVEHKERIHPDCPTIYVANHPNTMMDAMVAGYAVGKRIHFTAKSTIFANPIASWFLKKVGLVPIYRREDSPDQMGKNEDIFIRLYEHLETGGSFLIFPEGISISDRLLHEIKTGAARIAFGAEVRNKFSLNVQIVPVGLNYSDYQKFRSDVYCRFGYPIFINEYRDNYEKDPVQAVKEVTEKIKHQLEKVTTTLPESELSDLVDFVNTIYKKDLMVEMGLETKSVEDEFFVTKGIIDAVEWYKQHHPESTKIMSKEMGNYLRTLQRLQLRDDFLSPARKGIKFRRRLKSWFFLVFGFPVFLWGAINNFPGYKIPRVLTDR
ncbi:MAG: 1-acyl-sn-glycerol-3-phosphate acyltransferase, partial [Candidatus Marinimicrobia bacterium]|nr:1-acyl-sn-glycerol-3-phosphate acyltransferase [Candidatus Neomarinimicrobiota bacterium]